MKCSLLSGHLYELYVLDSLACQCGFDFEDINHFFFNCPSFGADKMELLTNLLTLGITNVNRPLLIVALTMMKNVIGIYLNLFITL